MIGECKVVIFMDDVIVHGKTRDELTTYVSEFLQQCRDENLCLKIAKSTFEMQEVDFLGYKVKNCYDSIVSLCLRQLSARHNCAFLSTLWLLCARVH